MGSQIFWFGYYSRDVVHCLDALLGPGQVFVDGGANIGEITLVAAKRVGPEGRVIAFEPMGSIRERLAANVDANRFAQVEIVGKGLSDAPGRRPIFVSGSDYEDGSSHSGLGTIYASQQRSAVASEIELTTLDAIMRDRDLERLDGIKLDIEGAELAAIRGAAELLRRFRPWLVVEIGRGTCNAAGYEPADILAALPGYEFARIGRKGRLDPIASGDLDDWQNVLCRPAA